MTGKKSCEQQIKMERVAFILSDLSRQKFFKSFSEDIHFTWAPGFEKIPDSLKLSFIGHHSAGNNLDFSI